MTSRADPLLPARSDLGSFDRSVVQEVLKDIAQTQQVDLNARKRFKGACWTAFPSHDSPLTPAHARTRPRTVVIINEADGMSRDAQSALRRTMEKFTSSLRIILCANSTSKIIGPIRSRCLLLRVGAPSENQVRVCLAGCSQSTPDMGSQCTQQIDAVLQQTATKEGFSVPPHVSLLLARISSGNLRRALLSFEALYTQDPDWKTIKPDHSLLKTGKQDQRDIDTVPRPDWEKYAAKAAERILGEQTPERLLEVRGMFYELLVHCIPATLVLSVRHPFLPPAFVQCVLTLVAPADDHAQVARPRRRGHQGRSGLLERLLRPPPAAREQAHLSFGRWLLLVLLDPCFSTC